MELCLLYKNVTVLVVWDISTQIRVLIFNVCSLPEGKKLLGRLARHRWEHKSTMELKELWRECSRVLFVAENID